MSEPGIRKTASVEIDTPVHGTWQRELARAITSVPDLLTAVGLEAGQEPLAALAAPGFPIRVPRGYVARIRRNDPEDPLLRQVMPLAAEAELIPGYGTDPVADLASMRSPGLLHKYHGRVLLVVTGACAIHCRYCFRREFPYDTAALTPRRLDAAMAEIEADSTIHEVILSGGDPLSLSDGRLNQLLERIGRIRHVGRIRLHTRQPVVLPERIDAGLSAVLRRSALPIVVVIHANHANEIDADVGAALSRLAGDAQALLNQSVLLRGINDSADALVDLGRRLFDHGVLPYYLHQLDQVSGTAHFAVTDSDARRIINEVAGRLPGYLVPKLVREVPGDPAKRFV